MEITHNIRKQAEDTLRFEGVVNLPKQIADSAFYVGGANDASILAHGVVIFEGVEYKIGTKQ
jgi:hypothetical protein